MLLLTCVGELRIRRENEAAFLKEDFSFFLALHYKVKLQQVGMTDVSDALDWGSF